MSQPPVAHPTSSTLPKIVGSGCSGSTPPMLAVTIWSWICRRLSSSLLERSCTKYVLEWSRRGFMGVDMASRSLLSSLTWLLPPHRGSWSSLVPLYLRAEDLSRVHNPYTDAKGRIRSRLSAGVRGCSPCAQKAVLLFAGCQNFRPVLPTLQYSRSSAKFIIPVRDDRIVFT